MSQTKWLGNEINENGIKPNEEKVEAILKLKPPENNTRSEIIPRGDTIRAKISTKAFGTDRSS